MKSFGVKFILFEMLETVNDRPQRRLLLVKVFILYFRCNII